jgi:hypothetical protein
MVYIIVNFKIYKINRDISELIIFLFIFTQVHDKLDEIKIKRSYSRPRKKNKMLNGWDLRTLLRARSLQKIF